MADTTYITVSEDSYDDLVSMYIKAQNTIMDLELEVYELQEELASAIHKLEQLD